MNKNKSSEVICRRKENILGLGAQRALTSNHRQYCSAVKRLRHCNFSYRVSYSYLTVLLEFNVPICSVTSEMKTRLTSVSKMEDVSSYPSLIFLRDMTERLKVIINSITTKRSRISFEVRMRSFTCCDPNNMKAIQR